MTTNSTLVTSLLMAMKKSMSHLTRISIAIHVTEKRAGAATMNRTTRALSGVESRPSPVRSKPRRAPDIDLATIGAICPEIHGSVPIHAQPARAKIIHSP